MHDYFQKASYFLSCGCEIGWPTAGEYNWSPCLVQCFCHLHIALGHRGDVRIATIQFQHVHAPLCKCLLSKRSSHQHTQQLQVCINIYTHMYMYIHDYINYTPVTVPYYSLQFCMVYSVCVCVYIYIYIYCLFL